MTEITSKEGIYVEVNQVDDRQEGKLDERRRETKRNRVESVANSKKKTSATAESRQMRSGCSSTNTNNRWCTLLLQRDICIF